MIICCYRGACAALELLVSNSVTGMPVLDDDGKVRFSSALPIAVLFPLTLKKAALQGPRIRRVYGRIPKI